MTRRSVTQSLRSLPPTLDATYDRILLGIAIEHRQIASNFLRWLCFGRRFLTLCQLAEVCAITLEDSPTFEPDQRLNDPTDILTICGSLTTTIRVEGSNGWEEQPRLAHSSVREYLLSKRIRTSKAAIFSLEERASTMIMTEQCLVYLTHPWAVQIAQLPESEIKDEPKYLENGRDEPLIGDETQESNHDDVLHGILHEAAPFFTHACLWIRYAEAIPDDQTSTAMMLLTRRLFDPRHAPHRLWRMVVSDESIAEHFAMLWWAHQLEICSLTRLVLYHAVDISMTTSDMTPAPQTETMNEAFHDELSQLVLEHVADENHPGELYGSPLQTAALANHESGVQILLERGYDPNARGGYYGTALHAAASLDGDFEEIVRLLLHAGADVLTQDDKGKVPLQIAIRYGHKRIYCTLLEESGKVYSQELIDERGWCSFDPSIGTPKRYHMSALEVAVSDGEEEFVEKLLRKGADINLGALHAAAESGQEAIIQLLLAHGADINAKTMETRGEGRRGERALHSAARQGRQDVLRFLLREGVDIDTRTEAEETALHIAVEHGKTDTVRFLLEQGADSNATNSTGETALHYAAIYGNTDTVQIQLEHGADINARDMDQDTVLSVAALWGQENVVQLLLDNNACIASTPTMDSNAKILYLRPLLKEPNDRLSRLLCEVRESYVSCSICSSVHPEGQYYHCSICDEDNFDLCQGCIDSGRLCNGEAHSLKKVDVQGVREAMFKTYAKNMSRNSQQEDDTRNWRLGMVATELRSAILEITPAMLFGPGENLELPSQSNC